MSRSVNIPGAAPPAPGSALRVNVEGKPIAVFQVGDRLYAIDAACTHVGGPLERGHVEHGVVTCPLHGSQFDLATGEVRRAPATRPVRTYPVRVEGTGLVIDV